VSLSCRGGADHLLGHLVGCDVAVAASVSAHLSVTATRTHTSSTAQAPQRVPRELVVMCGASDVSVLTLITVGKAHAVQKHRRRSVRCVQTGSYFQLGTVPVHLERRQVGTGA
jgi:hypothetical protein